MQEFFRAYEIIKLTFIDLSVRFLRFACHVKMNQHDRNGESVSVSSIAVPVRGRHLFRDPAKRAAPVRGGRLFEGGAYSSTYGS